MALSQIVITVAIDATAKTFTATCQEEQFTDTSFAGAVNGVMPKIAALHAQMQGIPDGELSPDGVAFRDTPLTF